jgi:ATP phosphoribosyltransferase
MTGSGAGKLVLALPSKGRLMEQCTAALARAGFTVTRPPGSTRGYKAEIEGFPDIEVNLVSASEIAQLLKTGAVHLGVTGEDLIRETMADADERVRFVAPLGFGSADVVVAVPACWLDVRRMADLEQMSEAFRRRHGRRVRVATKYMNLTRRYFAQMGVTGYRIVESLGATEGTPAAGLAELIVDITTTGATIQANGLKILEDGVILKSQANLMASRGAAWTPELAAIEAQIADKLGSESAR